MKRIILLMLVVIFSLPTLAQKSTGLFEKLTDKYSDNEGFSASQISKEMFDLYLKKRNVDEDSPIFDALKKLDNILVISQSNISGSPRNSEFFSDGSTTGIKSMEDGKNESDVIHKEILNYYKTSNFALLKTEKRMGEDVKVYLKKNQGKIESLALITNSSVSTNLVELKGDIDLKTVSELNQALNLRGLENLYKIDNSSAALYRYPGYARVPSEERIEEMVASQRELYEKQQELTSEQREKLELQAQLMAEKQMLMAEKYREMAEKYQREPIFLSTPGDTNTVYYIDGKKVKAKTIKEMDKDKIESVEIKKPEKEDEKTVIKIKTK